MRRLRCLLILALIINLSFGQGMDHVEIEPIQLSDKLYMLKGVGGNIAVLIGDEGTVLIDNQFAPLSEKILAVADSLSDSELKYVINTHWHGDYTGGNENMHKQGAIIVAHKNVKERMSKDQLMQAFSRKVEASPASAWPTVTYSDNLNIEINGELIDVIHVHNAHTDGDSFVYFPRSNVLHMGDCFFNGKFPFIDLSSNGSINGLISAVQLALLMTDEDTRIIPGHGDIASKKELSAYGEMITVMRDHVQDLMMKGKSLNEIKSSSIGTGFESFDGGFIKREKFIDFIWTSLAMEEAK